MLSSAGVNLKYFKPDVFTTHGIVPNNVLGVANPPYYCDSYSLVHMVVMEKQELSNAKGTTLPFQEDHVTNRKLKGFIQVYVYKRH